MHDKDQNGVLDAAEFGKLVATVSGKEDAFLGSGRSEREILQMYTDAIEVSSRVHGGLSLARITHQTRHPQSTQTYTDVHIRTYTARPTAGRPDTSTYGRYVPYACAYVSHVRVRVRVRALVLDCWAC